MPPGDDAVGLGGDAAFMREARFIGRHDIARVLHTRAVGSTIEFAPRPLGMPGFRGCLPSMPHAPSRIYATMKCSGRWSYVQTQTIIF
jgi:hypothetical protein